MLILTRRIGEVLCIGDKVKMHISGIKGNQVRINIQAPKEIPVHREEVYRRIQEEKRLATQETVNGPSFKLP